MNNILTPLLYIFLKNLDFIFQTSHRFFCQSHFRNSMIPYATIYMPQYYKNPNQNIIHSCAITSTRYYKNMDRMRIWNCPR